MKPWFHRDSPFHEKGGLEWACPHQSNIINKAPNETLQRGYERKNSLLALAYS